MYRLSILMCTVPEPFRDREFFNYISQNILSQAGGTPVQFLYLGDNRSITIGEKRNILMNASKADYLTFVDDDDQISEDYVETILHALDGSDCIAIGVQQTKDNQNEALYDYSPDHGRNYNTRINGRRIYHRIPDHLCVWKREIALRCAFPNKSISEDHEWAECQLAKGYTFKKIDKVIYHYDFSMETTLTRLR